MTMWTLALFVLQSHGASLPPSFDLRNVNGKKYVSAVKKQSGGTCWTHGTMASLESNLLKTGLWQSSGETGDADLAEYHLDWWNGFNENYNPDVSEVNGLTVHEGGDYRVAAAYLTRGTGAVRDIDGQSFDAAPEHMASNFKVYYPRDIEWYSVGPNLENIEQVKKTIQRHGVIGTALAWDTEFYTNGNFYQPIESEEEANHAVAIIGWDDAHITQAPKPGAWLAKNSWGTKWGNGGYFWISYYDKVAGHHPEMGAVSFQDVQLMPYKYVYFHDTHGWRDTKTGITDAMNAFETKEGAQTLRSVGFYSAANKVDYRIEIYLSFKGKHLSDLVSAQEGFLENNGYHTVDLNWPVKLDRAKKFYVLVSLSEGGHAFDRTSDVPVLLGSKGRVTVTSSAEAGQSFYRKNGKWIDLTQDDSSANFCIKAFSS